MGSVLKRLLRLWDLAAKSSKRVDRVKKDKFDTLIMLRCKFQLLRRTKRFLICSILTCIPDFTVQ
jgi:hypothetical protein